MFLNGQRAKRTLHQEDTEMLKPVRGSPRCQHRGVQVTTARGTSRPSEAAVTPKTGPRGVENRTPGIPAETIMWSGRLRPRQLLTATR